MRFKWTRSFSKTESFKTSRYVRMKAKQKDKLIACEHPPSPLRKHPKRGSSDFSEGGGGVGGAVHRLVNK